MNWAEVHFWAKTTPAGKPGHGDEPGISVRDHCLNVGCVAEALVARLPEPLRRLVPPGFATLAALHDVGKITPGFQSKCPAWLTRFDLASVWRTENWLHSEPDHGKVSAYSLHDWFGQRWTRPVASKLAHAIGAHHGSLFGSRLFSKPLQEKRSEEFSAARQALCRELEQVLGQLPERLDALETDSRLWLLAGMICVADWIGSGQWFSADGPKAGAPSRSVEHPRADATRALAELGWNRPSVRAELLFEDLFGFDSPTELQKQAANLAVAPGVVLVEAAMGAGKTEAALALAYRLLDAGEAGGLYFALPTQVTSNRIHLRVRDFLGNCLRAPAMLRLAHMNSWLRDDSTVQVPPAGRDDATPETARAWFSSSKRALLAPFGVGTIDQALLGVVAARHFFVRQFALAGKVVVLDEVHSYDLYTGTLVAQLVRALRELGATVVILSATLTAQRKRELLGLPDETPLESAYPLLTNLPRDGGPLLEQASAAGEVQRVGVRCVQLTEAEAAAECLRRAERGECVLWIRNTVAEAQAGMRRLRSDRCEGRPELALLHSRFPLFRRDQLERLWLNRLGKNPRRRPHGCVLVATQVVEQSVDVDADFLLTDLAPTDMLLQRIGRLWRHQGRPKMAACRPASAKREIWVNHPVLAGEADAQGLETALGRSAHVYAPYVLLRSLTEWRQVAHRGTLTLPTDIRPLLEATYDPAQEAADPPAWGELRKKLERQAAELRQGALGATRVWTLPDLKDEEDVQTRWRVQDTASLLLVRGAEVFRCTGSRAKDGLRLRPLHGGITEVLPYQWDFKAARTMHRNLVRLPAWLVRDGIARTQEALGPAAKALARHAHGEIALGIVQGSVNGPIRWPGAEAPESRLFCDEDLGIETLPRPSRRPSPATLPPDDDEPDD